VDVWFSVTVSKLAIVVACAMCISSIGVEAVVPFTVSSMNVVSVMLLDVDVFVVIFPGDVTIVVFTGDITNEVFEMVSVVDFTTALIWDIGKLVLDNCLALGLPVLKCLSATGF